MNKYEEAVKLAEDVIRIREAWNRTGKRDQDPVERIARVLLAADAVVRRRGSSSPMEQC